MRRRKESDMKAQYARLAGLILLVIIFTVSLAWIARMTFRASIAGSTLPIQFITQINAVDLLAVLIAVSIVVVVGSVILTIGAALLAIRDIAEEIQRHKNGGPHQ
jgi:ABC-type spermidine/putrescine transport system permease subunit II